MQILHRTDLLRKLLHIICLGSQVTLLGAMAMLLGESTSVEEAVVQQGLHVVGRIVQAYRGLWPKPRGPVHSALNTYLMALMPTQVVLQLTLPQFVGLLLTHTLKPAEDNLVSGRVHCPLCCVLQAL